MPVSGFICFFAAYILNIIVNTIVSRKFTLSKVFKQLGLIFDLSVDDEDNNNNNDNNAEKLCPVEDDEDDEEVAVTVDDEGDIEAFEERNDSEIDDDDDGGASSDEASNSDQSDTEGPTFDFTPSRAGILYATHEISS